MMACQVGQHDPTACVSSRGNVGAESFKLLTSGILTNDVSSRCGDTQPRELQVERASNLRSTFGDARNDQGSLAGFGACALWDDHVEWLDRPDQRDEGMTLADDGEDNRNVQENIHRL